MTNYQKYLKIKDMFDKLNSAMKNGYWYEAIFLEYAWMESRLAAVLSILDINIYNSDETEFSIDKKIRFLKKIDNPYIKARFSNKLLDEIRNWKENRNNLIHNLIISPMSDYVRNIAESGYIITKKVSISSSSVLKKYKKLNEKRTYYMLNKDCYIRCIDDVGYIKKIGIFTDLTFDKSGCIFLEALGRKPQALELLSEEISKKFKGVNALDIQQDVREFFDMLCEDGYVCKGRNYSETILNNKGFTYEDVTGKQLNGDLSPEKCRSEFDTQTLLSENFTVKPHLSSFQIELTSRCNERCIHCYIPHQNKNSDISDELFYGTLKQLKSMGTLGLTLSGGEPLLHPHFAEYLKAAKKEGFFVNILSNAVNLNDDLIQLCRKGNTCAFQISLYSMCPEHHDAVTKLPGSFEKTKANILKLINNDIPVQISCPVMKVNKDDVAGVIQWCHEHKIRANVDYAIMAEYDHCMENLTNRLTPDECRNVINAIIVEDSDYQKSLQTVSPNLESINKIDPEENFCGVGIDTCCMVANGNVYPCPGWQGFVCGNLNEQTLEDIWANSEGLNKLRNLKRKDMPKCLNCENRDYCSPCLGRFANESKTGNPLEIAQHFCDVAAVNKEVVQDWITKNKK